MKPWAWLTRKGFDSSFRLRRDGRFEYRGSGPALWAYVVTIDERAKIESRLLVPIRRGFLLAAVFFVALYAFLIWHSPENWTTALFNGFSLCALFNIWSILWERRHLAGVPRLQTPDIRAQGNIWVRLFVRMIVRQQEAKVLGYAFFLAAVAALVSVVWVAKFNAGKFDELYEGGTLVLLPVLWLSVQVLQLCFRPRIGAPGVPLEVPDVGAQDTAKQRRPKEEGGAV